MTFLKKITAAMSLEDYEDEYGPSEKWGDAILSDFSYWDAWRAGHVYANNPSAQKKLEELKKLVKSEKDMDKAISDMGVAYTSESKKEYEQSLKKYLKKNEAYFSDAFPDGSFDDSAFGFIAFDLDKGLAAFKK